MTTITIDRNALVRAMAHLARVVEQRNTIPILGNVRLSARDQTLTLTATDLDIEARVTVDCDVSGSGDITVPAGTMNDIVRKIAKDTPVTLDWDGGGTKVAVRAGRSRFHLASLPAGDFPDLAAGEISHRFTLPAATLLAMIEATFFAVSTEEVRYYLNGIYLHCLNDGADNPLLRGVATDGHRLARFDVPAPEGASGMPGIIVPRKTADEIARLAREAMGKDGGGDIEISLSTTRIRVSSDNVTLTSKLVDGTFPDYGRVIPIQNITRAVLSRAALAGAVDRVAVMSSERGAGVKLSFEARRLRLSAASPDTGSAEDEVEAEYDGAGMEIGFNSRYLADILAALEGDTVIVKLGDPGSPTIFQPSEDDRHLVVLMPMRV